jgi:hypothetical protein
MGLRLVEGGKGPPKHLNYDTSDVTGIPQTSLFYLRTSSEERLHRHCILGHPELPLFKVQALGQLTTPTSDLLQAHMCACTHTHTHTHTHTQRLLRMLGLLSVATVNIFSAKSLITIATKQKKLIWSQYLFFSTA